MPRIVHDGAKHIENYQSLDLSDPNGSKTLLNFLATYFDDVPNSLRIIGKSGWSEAISLLAGMSEESLYNLRRTDIFTSYIRMSAERDSGLSAASAPPRTIFISHRQYDQVEAIELANDITTHGKFDVWLDIFDPSLNALNGLNLSPKSEAILTALIIEMGLVNSVGLLALVTPNSAGSAWIPYEYGRAKTGGPYAQMAAVYRRDIVQFESYMELGPVIDFGNPKNNQDLDFWLDSI